MAPILLAISRNDLFNENLIVCCRPNKKKKEDRHLLTTSTLVFSVIYLSPLPVLQSRICTSELAPATHFPHKAKEIAESLPTHSQAAQKKNHAMHQNAGEFPEDIQEFMAQLITYHANFFLVNPSSLYLRIIPQYHPHLPTRLQHPYTIDAPAPRRC